MSDTKEFDLTYTGISLSSTGVAALSTVIGELAEKNIDHTVVYFWEENEWSFYKTPKAITSINWPNNTTNQTYCLSADGYFITVTDDDENSIQIDDGIEGPSDLVIMKELRLIGDDYFAVGMARHAYRSKAPQAIWHSIDTECFVPRSKRNKVIGFTSIDGFNAKECYAVGYDGEIWRYDGHGWHQEQSPTNVLLSKVVCDRHTGIVWIVGLAGTVVLGRHNEWRIFPQNSTSNDFWGVEAFAESVFLSGDSGVYKVDDENLIKCRLDKRRRKWTTSYLAENSRELWSVGDKDIYRTSDGQIWERLPAP